MDWLRGRNNARDQQFSLYTGESWAFRGFLMQKFPEFREDDCTTVCDIMYEFVSQGIITPGQGGQSSGMEWPWYRVTPYGRKVLEAREYVPHDPDGYLAKLQTDIPTLDPIIIRYLGEGLRCRVSGYLLAAPVMIGCASEKAMMILIETFRDAITDAAKKAVFERDLKPFAISKKYEALWERLKLAQAMLPPALKEDLQVLLDQVFDLIRTVRNDVGHPTGKVVDRETVLANFILFPGYCKRVYGLIEHYRHNPAIF